MLPNVGFGELAMIFVVGLILFGPDRLPKIARGLGEALRAFRDELRAVNVSETEKKEEKPDEPRKPSGV